VKSTKLNQPKQGLSNKSSNGLQGQRSLQSISSLQKAGQLSKPNELRRKNNLRSIGSLTVLTCLYSSEGLKVSIGALGSSNIKPKKFTLQTKQSFLNIKTKLGEAINTPRTANDKFNKSRRQENYLVSIFNGRRHLGSGAFFFDRSDLSSDLYRVEAKRTDSLKNIKIEQGYMDKLEVENASDSRVTFLALEITNQHYGFIRAAHIIELEKEMGTYDPEQFLLVGTLKPRNEIQKSLTVTVKQLELLNCETEKIPLLTVEFNTVNYSIVRIDYLQKLQQKYLEYKGTNGQS
jgi:hypothetical protein